MANIKIQNLPVKIPLDTMKIPTGGFGDYAVTIGQIAEHFKLNNGFATKDQLDLHTNDKENPHNVTKEQVGLGNVDNTSDVNKPVSFAVQEALNKKSDKNNTYTKSEVDRIEVNLEDLIAAYANTGNKAYKTLVDAQSDIENIPINSAVFILNDYNADNNGLYQWDGTALNKSSLDYLEKSRHYTDKEISSLTNKITLKKSDDPDIIPILADKDGKALVYYDKNKDLFVGGGLLEQIFTILSQIKRYEDDRYIAILVDALGNILLGWDKLKDEPVGFTTSSLSMINTDKRFYYFSKSLEVKDVNHVVVYGQSLGLGATAINILSNSQPYFNITFNTGPRQDSPATSIIPLVEMFNNPSSDGYDNRGETVCSGMANYASVKMMTESGIDPQEHVIFASTAGHGSYRIDQLNKGTAWYNFLLDHVTKAKNLNAGKSFQVNLVPWIQGENDAITGTQTPYSVYKNKLIQLQKDVDSDIKEITGQVDDVRFMTYQVSYAARTHPDIAKAQLDLSKESDKFMLSTPMYHFPYAVDNVHLTNVGYKWFGAYIGRAYKQYVIDGRKPDFLNPVSAYVNGKFIHVKFYAPNAPLVLDNTTLAPTTDYGFRVTDNGNTAGISNITVEGEVLTIELQSEPVGDVYVRYALDYLGTGINLTGGASGNLRDSTTDSVDIGGVSKPLYHVCPHFEMKVNKIKGI
ncbi:hypothetical protein Phab24_id164 [Acinetobacter phage Phab24]|nr:hypothetical protein Phab24_id164 [Acinetobacter phage Phab24]